MYFLNTAQYNILNFFIAFIISTFFVYLIIKFASNNKYFFDFPNLRKQHKDPTLKIGGLGFVSSFYILIFLNWIFNKSDSFLNVNNELLLIICFTAGLCFLVGIIDDIVQISPFFRLLSQIIITFFLWSKNIGIEAIAINIFKFNITFEVPELLGFIITFLWISGFINGFNWLDGLDGLASGLAIIQCSFILYFAYINGWELITLLSTIIIGATVGFLIHNRYPSSIMMGDGGSYFLGYLIAIFTLFATNSYQDYQLINKNELNIIPCFLTLFLPIADMTFVIIKRLVNGKSPFLADRSHIHHTLLEYNIDQKTTIVILFSISILFGFLATAI